MAIGTALRPFFLHAPQATALLTVLLTPFIALLLTALLRAMGTGPGLTILVSAFYLYVFLSPLQKPMNMSLSLPLSVAALLLLLRAWQFPRRLSILAAGVTIGLLPWVYFWS